MKQLITIHGVRGFIDENGTAQLNLEDVSRGLGFTDNSKGTEYVKWDRVRQYLTDIRFSTEVSKETFVPENIFYRLAMKAKNEVAEAFQIKVADEILPSIRKTGSYSVEQFKIPQNLTEALRLAADLSEKNEQLALITAEQQQKIEQDKPKVHFAESVEISKDSILVADLSKLLRQKGLQIGEIRLFKILREEGYLIKSGSEYNKPTQRSMELGLFEIKTGHRGSSDGTIKLTYTSKVTGKGQMYFINKFLKTAS